MNQTSPLTLCPVCQVLVLGGDRAPHVWAPSAASLFVECDGDCAFLQEAHAPRRHLIATRERPLPKPLTADRAQALWSTGKLCYWCGVLATDTYACRPVCSEACRVEVKAHFDGYGDDPVHDSEDE